MVGMIVKLLIGVVLFAGSLLGGLAATGRLNHEGTANIPVLSGLFPPPPVDPKAKEGADGAHGTEGAHPPTDPHGAPVDADATPAGAANPAATDAAHETEHSTDPNAQDPTKPKKPNQKKVGKSVVEPEKEEAAGGHGAPAEAHGADPHAKPEEHGADPHAKPDAHGADSHGADSHGKTPKEGRSPEGDFTKLEHSLHNTGSQYKPGDMFRFAGLPAGVTAEEINEAWQKVQGLMADVDRRKTVLEEREKVVQELHEETGRRQAALANERVQLEQMQRELDAKIEKFKDQVKMVRNDEVAALKKNAQTLGSFEATKAAELIETMWKSDKGQDEVLKTFEFMDKDAVNEILKVMPNPMIQDVMKKRMRVSREAAAPAK